MLSFAPIYVQFDPDVQTALISHIKQLTINGVEVEFLKTGLASFSIDSVQKMKETERSGNWFQDVFKIIQCSQNTYLEGWSGIQQIISESESRVVQCGINALEVYIIRENELDIEVLKQLANNEDNGVRQKVARICTENVGNEKYGQQIKEIIIQMKNGEQNEEVQKILDGVE
ncbi:Hypothetical_protein [Hexamita inflata]|uniref:Hypothetical_protein n=1 Tax=Hexamita inflata TaxID=28002 RepID=A0AA86PBX7_9EUKA|nr:Hypothetical protein HINF_LOCUS22586 [Hexamita inflata]